MDLNHFLHQRRPAWQRFSALLDRVDARGLAALLPSEADEFFSLYRSTSSDLSLVQTRTGSLGLVEYLEGLIARAYAHLVVPPKTTFFRSWWAILRHQFPATLRREWRLLAVSTLTLVIGTLVGFVATFVTPAVASTFLPSEQLSEAPRDRVSRLENDERSGHRSISGGSDNAAFATFLFNNNIRVSVLAFALGLTLGVGTLILLFYNGAMLGSLAALYILDGEGKFFIAWVGPHGSIELPCVIIAGTAGLMLAVRQLRRSEGPFLMQARAARPELIDLLVGAATLLVIAGSIEGGFSQINEPTISYTLKIIVAAVLFMLLLLYLFIVPVKPRLPDGAG